MGAYRRSAAGGAAAVLLFLVAGRSLASDIYIKQNTVVSGIPGRPPRTSEARLWISGKTIRAESTAAPRRAILIDLAGGGITFLDMPAKAYARTTMDEYRARLRGAMKMLGAIELRETGKIRQVGRWNCREVVLTAGGKTPFTMVMWVSPDVGIPPDVYRDIMRFAGSAALAGLTEKFASLKGYPVKTIVTMKQGETYVTTTTTVTDVSFDPISAEMFRIPPGFKERAAALRPPAQGEAPTRK